MRVEYCYAGDSGEKITINCCIRTKQNMHQFQLAEVALLAPTQPAELRGQAVCQQLGQNTRCRVLRSHPPNDAKTGHLSDIIFHELTGLGYWGSLEKN